jgi:hypothetical protein
MKCEFCKENDAECISFCYDEYGQRDGEKFLCHFCHSERVNSSRGIIWNFEQLEWKKKVNKK